ARVLMFGGRDGPTLFGDTWTYDGLHWQLLAGNGPSPRFHGGIAFDSARGRVVLVGGQIAPYVYIGDTWAHDRTQWLLRASRPLPTAFVDGLAYDPQRAVTVLLMEGASIGQQLRVFEWNGSSWTPHPAPVGPYVGGSAGFVHDPRRQRTVLLNGAITGAV